MKIAMAFARSPPESREPRPDRIPFVISKIGINISHLSHFYLGVTFWNDLRVTHFKESISVLQQNLPNRKLAKGDMSPKPERDRLFKRRRR